MSPPSLILLSDPVARESLEAALRHVPAGERLLIVPSHLQESTGPEPALNISSRNRKLYLQLIDSAIAALRPKTIIANVAGLELVTATLDRHPQLTHAILLTDDSDKKKQIKALSGQFKTHQNVSVSQ